MAATFALDVPAQSDLSDEVEELVKHAQDLIGTSRAEATHRAYASDWRDFLAFCERHVVEPLPAGPVTVALYIADMASVRELSSSTIGRRMAALSVMHAESGHQSPTEHPQVRKLLRGSRRMKGTAPISKRALTKPELSRMIAAAGDDLADLRDRALLLVGFVGGLRRSELVGINVGDLQLGPDGYALKIRRSKTDQEGAGRTVALPYSTDLSLCPVTALVQWLEAAEIERGAVFRRIRRGGHVQRERMSPQSVNLRIKQHAKAAGVDEIGLGGHSLRSGFATAAAAAGASERAIANQTGHKSIQVLRRYVKQATIFDDNAATELGL
mgnify:CR=1 FL=1